MGLYTMLLEGPVLALLISMTLRASSSPEYTFATALHIPSYLFLATIVAMFFGLTGAASEVLKDRALLKRESNAKVFVTGYVLAKALVLTGLSAVQSALFLWVGNSILEIHEMFLIYLGTMTLTAFVGVSLSLLVSVFARTERAALNMVPLLLIPQILMAGAIVRFDEMNQFIPWSAHRTDEHGRLKPGRVPLVAEFCPLRYSFETMVVDQASKNVWERERETIQEKVDDLKERPHLDDREFEEFQAAQDGAAPHCRYWSGGAGTGQSRCPAGEEGRPWRFGKKLQADYCGIGTPGQGPSVRQILLCQ